MKVSVSIEPQQGKVGVVDEPTRDGFDKSWNGYILPAKYLVMVEFESLAMAQGSLAYVNVKPEILFVHGPKVPNNCIQVPSVRIAETMLKEHTYREVL
jgi:sulfur oxygenase/reductase